MKESQFIEKNKDKWIAFEEAATQKDKKPGYLSKLFVQITDDLSYARTFYPNRFIRYYLNGLAQSVFMDVNKRSKLGLQGMIRFWTTSLPLANYNARKEFWISLIIFTLAFFIGMASLRNDPGFATTILGEEYMAMTLNNIEKGDPMGVYKSFLPFYGFLHITLNNLMVAAWTFIFGAFAAIGTVFILLYNGVMVGTFQQFFIQEGYFKISFLTIWQHGAMEVTSIVIAGAAGLTMGKGLLFPGTLSRMVSFRQTAMRGLKIFVGIFPPIIIAAFIEGYYTRMTYLPDWLRATTIILTLGAMVVYYFWYPHVVARREKTDDLEDGKYEPPEERNPNFERLSTGTQMLEGAIMSFGKILKRIIWPVVILTSIKTLVLMLLYKDFWVYWFLFEIDISDQGWPYVFNYDLQPVMFFVNLVLMSFFFYLAYKNFAQLTVTDLPLTGKAFKTRLAVVAVLLSLLINALFIVGFWIGFLILIFLFPLVAMFAFTYLKTSLLMTNSVKEGWEYFFYKSGKSFGLILKAGFITLLFIYIYSRIANTFIYMLLAFVNPFAGHFIHFILGLFFILSIYLGVLLIVSAIGVLYLAKQEVITAEHLLNRIDNFGQSRKIFGYERE